MAISLTAGDFSFLFDQVTLPGNIPLTPIDNTGVRDVRGVANNVNNPTFGAVDQLFPRMAQQWWTSAQGTVNAQFQFIPGATSYSVRNTTLFDAQPRIISNLIASQTGLTALQVQDNPVNTNGARVSPLTGTVNPLPYSSFTALFGQFFDHGLDFVHKGADGTVVVPLLPSDPLYNDARLAGVPFFFASRTNTINVTLGAGTGDQLARDLGLWNGTDVSGSEIAPSWTAVTGTKDISLGLFTGNLVLNNHIISLVSATSAQVVAAINAEASSTGVTASLNGTGNLVLTPATGEAQNTISPFIDLSQSYGSAPSHTVFVREYTATGQITGRLVSGAGADKDGDGKSDAMATWADIKANALKIGLTLHDYNVTDVPLVKLAADGTADMTAGHAWFVAMNKTTGEIVYVQDTDKSALTAANLVLMTTGHAFLDDMAHGVLSAVDAHGDVIDSANRALLDQHFIAGDGRANENIGLTAIHDIFHAEHNRVYAMLVAKMGPQQADGTYIETATGRVWTTEMLFQASKLVTEMEYQHLVFGEFARKLSPNINAFAAYDVSLDPGITAEFAHAVYRFGHSMLTETVSLMNTDGSALTTGGPKVDGGTASEADIKLLDAFLNPGIYTSHTAGEVAAGMSNQVANAIDEWMTDALRNNLVGLPLDLATLNMVRARDSGVPSLNATRADLYAQTGLETLRPYSNWDEFGANLLHKESLHNFIAAYATAPVLALWDPTGSKLAAYNTSMGYTGGAEKTWAQLQASAVAADSTFFMNSLNEAATAAMNDAGFMGGALGLNDIDLWIGGLAEQKVAGGMLGSTFDFVFAHQMIMLQSGDRFYYLDRLVGTDLLAEIEGQLFSDIIMRNTGTKHLYSDIFSVADANVEASALQTGGIGTFANPYGTQFAHQNAVSGSALNSAAYVTTTFLDPLTSQNITVKALFGNPGNYQDARGVLNPNGAGNASEMLGGTDGTDYVFGLGGNDTIWGDGGTDFIDGGNGNDFLHGGLDNDYITDTQGDDLLWGDDGDDVVKGGAGLDQVFGGNGNDKLYGGTGGDVMDGGEGDDVLYGDNGAIAGGVLDPNGDADVLTGGAGNDTLYGGGGADALDGGEGDDILVGGAGNDGMIGWDGNDTFVMNDGDFGYNNVIDGGLGFDTVDYSGSRGHGVTLGGGRYLGVTIDLSNAGVGVVPVGINVPDSYLSVERAIGTRFDDIIVGGTGVQTDQAGNPIPRTVNGVPQPQLDANGNAVRDPLTGQIVYQTIPMSFTIEGLDGNDNIVGGAGNDTLDGGVDIDTVNFYYSATAVNANLATGVATGEGNDTLLGFENIVGSTLADTLVGDAGNNVIDGSDGADNINGGAGSDGASYIFAATAVNVTLGNNGNGTATLASGNDTLTSIENIIGGAFNDTITDNSTGAGTNNIFDGGAGNDNINAGLGNDFIVGGAGNDTINGGGGTDVALFYGLQSAYTITYNANGSVTVAGPEGTDTISNVETLRFADGDVTVVVPLSLTANADAYNDAANTNNSVLGLAGNDTMRGNGGADILDGGVGDDLIDGGVDADMLLGNAGNDILMGGFTGSTNPGLAAASTAAAVAANAIVAGVGFDGAIDTLDGGAGNDIYVWDGSDIIVEAVNGGTDTVIARQTVDLAAQGALFPNVENVMLSGTADINATGNGLANALTGNAGVNSLDGGAGNDVLDGGAGADTLIGGAGDDTFIVDAADTVVETAGGGVDTVQSAATYSIATLTEVENVTLTGAANVDATGNAGANVLTGNGGNNVLTSGGGNDTINGGAGTDIAVLAGANLAFYSVNATTTSTVLTGQDGSVISLAGIETIRFADASEVAAPTVLTTANNTFNGAATADWVFGLAGTDTLNGNDGNDILDGGDGNDTLNGGNGDDILIGAAGSDVMNGGAGIDTVSYAEQTGNVTVNLTLTTAQNTGAAGQDTITNVENITGGSGSDTLTGSNADNVLNGGAGVDTMSGGLGNDTLNGGTGADRLTGGAGNDIFVFNAALNSGVDTITDFAVGDRIHLDDAVFTGLTAGQPVSYAAASAATIAGAQVFYNAATGALFFDADGTGGGAAVQFAQLSAGLTLGAGDFVVI